jgi:ubiquinone/menaquinone biosynthesis C-methylase UbiE
MTTRDLFGDRADEYARTRPTYPDALFELLSGLAAGHELAWDCGAGSGQASRSLARRFSRVLATDTSLRQLAHARVEGGMMRIAAAAEAAPIRDRCVDLVTVSAAIHWFDRPKFYEEVKRVARPGAIIAAWSYFQTRITPEIDAVLVHYADRVVGELWNTGIQLNRGGYRDLEFPFERLPWPEMHAEGAMRLEDMRQYMRTWSASQAWERTHGSDPVAVVGEALARAWGAPQALRIVRWPLHGAIGRVR